MMETQKTMTDAPLLVNLSREIDEVADEEDDEEELHQHQI